MCQCFVDDVDDRLMNLHCLCPSCSYVCELLVDLGVEAADVRKKLTEEELKVATGELTCDTPAASLETSGEHIDLLR